GLTMCGEVIRVRNMRAWYFGFPPPPPNFQMAPPASGIFRRDTIQPDPDGDFHFDNQSDDTPQPLALKLYNGSPHPILDGIAGPINQFPDHMHEGEVLVPTYTTDQPTYDNQQFVEYPVKQVIIKGRLFTYQPLPEVIAEGTVIGGHTTITDE